MPERRLCLLHCWMIHLGSVWGRSVTVSPGRRDATWASASAFHVNLDTIHLTFFSFFMTKAYSKVLDNFGLIVATITEEITNMTTKTGQLSVLLYPTVVKMLKKIIVKTLLLIHLTIKNKVIFPLSRTAPFIKFILNLSLKELSAIFSLLYFRKNRCCSVQN